MLRQSFSLKKPSKSRRLSSCGWKVREIKLLTLRRCFVCVCVCVSLSLSFALHHLLRTSWLRQPWLPSLPSSWSSPMACREAWYAFTSFPFFFSFFFPFFLFFHLFVGSFWSYRNLADRGLVSVNLIDWLPFFRLIFFFPADLGLDRFLRV
jgi:hypothetical protein